MLGGRAVKSEYPPAAVPAATISALDTTAGGSPVDDLTFVHTPFPGQAHGSGTVGWALGIAKSDGGGEGRTLHGE